MHRSRWPRIVTRHFRHLVCEEHNCVMDLSLVGMTQSADHSQSVTQIAVLCLDSYAQFNTICSESLSKLKRGVLFMKNN